MSIILYKKYIFEPWDICGVDVLERTGLLGVDLDYHDFEFVDDWLDLLLFGLETFGG